MVPIEVCGGEFESRVDGGLGSCVDSDCIGEYGKEDGEDEK